jgi:hypothetical protein
LAKGEGNKRDKKRSGQDPKQVVQGHIRLPSLFEMRAGSAGHRLYICCPAPAAGSNYRRRAPMAQLFVPRLRSVGLGRSARARHRHPSAAISSLIPSVSCRRCSPNAPFARLEMLTARTGDDTDGQETLRGRSDS